jgi:hypothetical protein
MTSVSGRLRSDWPLIKHLSKTYSPKLGLQWQKLPYIDLTSYLDRCGMAAVLAPISSSGRDVATRNIGSVGIALPYTHYHAGGDAMKARRQSGLLYERQT